MYSGIQYFFSGFKLILKPGIKRFVIIPLIINIFIFATGFWLGITWFEAYLAKILPLWLAWAEYILWPLFAISYLLIIFYLFALLANIIAAPFNGLLAERIELLIHARNNNQEVSLPKSTFTSIIKEAPRTIGSEINKLFYFLLRSAPVLILFFIPGINLFAPFIWFIFSAWMLSLEYLDYPLGNHNILFKQTRILVKSHKMKCLSFGGLISVFTMIPIVNFIVMPMAVAGATVFFVDAINLDKHT